MTISDSIFQTATHHQPGFTTRVRRLDLFLPSGQGARGVDPRKNAEGAERRWTLPSVRKSAPQADRQRTHRRGRRATWCRSGQHPRTRPAALHSGDFGPRTVSECAGDAQDFPALGSAMAASYGGLPVIGAGRLGERLSAFPLKFSKASNTAIHLYRSVGLTHIARVKGDALPPRISLSEFDSTSRSYKIHIGERFLARNTSGRLLIGRITKIQDDSRGDSKDWVTFKYLYNWDPGDEIDSI